MDDDQLIERLRRLMVDVDPVPAAVVEGARAAIAFRDVDAAFARLVADSADPSLADAFEPVRTDPVGHGGGRVLSFAGGGIQIDLEIRRIHDRNSLLGHLTGQPVDQCLLEFVDRPAEPVILDDLGRFSIETVRRGSMRLRCRLADDAQVATSWILG